MTALIARYFGPKLLNIVATSSELLIEDSAIASSLEIERISRRRSEMNLESRVTRITKAINVSVTYLHRQCAIYSKLAWK